MNISENRNRNIAIIRYGKKARLLLGNGVPEEYILTACKMCDDIDNATNTAILIKQWIKYVPDEMKPEIHSMTYNQLCDKLKNVLESRKVPNCFMQVGSWMVGEFDNWEDCKLFPIPNEWCICEDPKWIDTYHNNDSRLLIIYSSFASKYFMK